jgi:putative ABC transport system ATP-binding protein
LSTPVVQLVNAKKVYARGLSQVIGLDGLDFQVLPGEMVSVMGPSGCGKSTLMNVLGTLDRLDGGEYFFEGQPIAGLDDPQLSQLRSKRVGFVFQQFHLLTRYTALENVELPMVYARAPKAERRARAEKALDMVGLKDRMDHLPTELSGGQQQRVAIARSLVNDPALLLADEPTGALDSATSVEILRLFRELNERGVTIFMVTHDAEVARSAKRLIRMKDGKVVSDEAVVRSVGAA